MWGFAIFFYSIFSFIFFPPSHLEGPISVGSSPRPRRAERPPPAEGPGRKVFLGFCVSATKGFYRGPVPSGQGRRPSAPRAHPAGGRRKGRSSAVCSAASAAPAAACGAFSLRALTLFSRRDALAGLRLPGDGCLRPGLKSNFSGSGVGAGGNHPLPPARPSARRRGPQAAAGPAAARRARPGEERRSGQPPCLLGAPGEAARSPGAPRGTQQDRDAVSVGSADERPVPGRGAAPRAVVWRAGRGLLLSCHPSVCPVPSTLRADGPKPGGYFYLPSSPPPRVRPGVKPTSVFPPWWLREGLGLLLCRAEVPP